MRFSLGQVCLLSLLLAASAVAVLLWLRRERVPERTLKADRATMLYHTPDSPYYARVTADAWFATPEEAAAAGFTGWNRRVR